MKKYVLPILGALVGGIVATLPWILAYVYLNMMFSILAMFVAMGALFGYQLCKGEVNKRLPLKIVIVSLLSITIATLVIIPSLLLIREGATVSINNFKYLYSDSDFLVGILKNYVISIIFTFLGISGVIGSIKNQVANDSKNIKIDLKTADNKKEKMLIKNILVEHGAKDSNNVYVFNDNDKINENTLNFLLANGEVVKVNDGYYYDDKKESADKKQLKKTIIIFSIIFVVFLGLGIYFNLSNKESDNNELIKYSVPSGYIKYDDKEGGYYYLLEDDLSGEIGYIDIYNLEGNYEYSVDYIDRIKSNIETECEIIEYEIYTNNYNHHVAYFKLNYDDYTAAVYYIFSGSDLGAIEVINYSDNSKLYSDSKDIANDFTWNKEVL